MVKLKMGADRETEAQDRRKVPVSGGLCARCHCGACSDCGRKRGVARLGARDLPDGSRTVFSKNAGNHTLAALRDRRHDMNLCDVVFTVRQKEREVDLIGF